MEEINCFNFFILFENGNFYNKDLEVEIIIVFSDGNKEVIFVYVVEFIEIFISVLEDIENIIENGSFDIFLNKVVEFLFVCEDDYEEEEDEEGDYEEDDYDLN